MRRSKKRHERGAVLVLTALSLTSIIAVMGVVVDGSRVYAFGHPFYGLGPTRFPMTRATVVTVLPSLASSSKIAIPGDVIGIVQQDRATTIAGTLGEGPELIPLTISLKSERGTRKTFTMGMVSDQLDGERARGEDQRAAGGGDLRGKPDDRQHQRRPGAATGASERHRSDRRAARHGGHRRGHVGLTQSGGSDRASGRRDVVGGDRAADDVDARRAPPAG